VNVVTDSVEKKLKEEVPVKVGIIGSETIARFLFKVWEVDSFLIGGKYVSSGAIPKWVTKSTEVKTKVVDNTPSTLGIFKGTIRSQILKKMPRFIAYDFKKRNHKKFGDFVSILLISPRERRTGLRKEYIWNSFSQVVKEQLQEIGKENLPIEASLEEKVSEKGRAYYHLADVEKTNLEEIEQREKKENKELHIEDYL